MAFVLLVEPSEENPCCHSPGTSYGTDHCTRDHHGPQSLCALEEHATQCASCHGVCRVMLAPEIANAGVEAVICDGDDTGRVSEERTPARDSVEN